MIKIILKQISGGYKIMICNKSYSFIKKSRKLKNKYDLYPKQLLGYIIKRNNGNFNNNYIIALDMVQLYLWLSLGAQFSKSFYRYSLFFRYFIN